MLSFRINSLQEGVSANGGFRLDVATAPASNPRFRFKDNVGGRTRPFKVARLVRDFSANDVFAVLDFRAVERPL
jgi:hypothetical protein